MNKLKIKKIVVGPIETNCYLLAVNNKLAVIDPGDEADEIISEIEKLGKVTPKYILLTHGHYDHVMAVKGLRKKFGFRIVISEKDKDISVLNLSIGVKVEKIQPDIVLPAEDTNLCIGKEDIRVIKTPGHTKGSVSYLVGDSLFSGDTLFKGSHGRIDLPGGSSKDMKKSLEKLLSLDGNVRVYPGHGPETTIGAERGYYR